MFRTTNQIILDQIRQIDVTIYYDPNKLHTCVTQIPPGSCCFAPPPTPPCSGSPRDKLRRVFCFLQRWGQVVILGIDVYILVCVCLSVCMSVCLYVCICMYIYIQYRQCIYQCVYIIKNQVHVFFKREDWQAWVLTELHLYRFPRISLAFRMPKRNRKCGKQSFSTLSRSMES